MANKNLNAAKAAKKDEFYTEMTDIERELQHYWSHFQGKVVFCNCDDPYESNFFKYFALHFNHLGLKKLICTCYNGSPMQGNELVIDFGDLSDDPKKVAFKVEITEVKDLNGDGAVDLSDVRYLLQNDKNVISILKTGDFRDPRGNQSAFFAVPRVYCSVDGIWEEIFDYRKHNVYYMQRNISTYYRKQPLVGAKHNKWG